MFTITMTIARPIADVFHRLARIQDAPLWYSAVTSVDRIDAGPVDVGSRFRFRRNLGSREVVNEVELTAYDRYQILELRSVSGPTPFVYRYELFPLGASTKLLLTGDISGEGIRGPVAAFKPLAEMFFRSGMIDNLRAFKRLVEA